MSPLLKVEGLSKIYNRHRPDELLALKNLSFEISAGEVVALTGPSGSGKTTLLSLLGSMSRPTSGRIFLKDRNISKLPERFMARLRRDSFGFVFQQYNLLRDLNVLENVMLPLYPSEQPWNEIKQAAVQLLERFDLSAMQRKKVKLLSGGEQQRVAIARALIADPDIVIADEPTAHLDLKLSEEFLAILDALNKEGKTIIIATHDPAVYEARLIKRILNLSHGQIDKDSAP